MFILEYRIKKTIIFNSMDYVEFHIHAQNVYMIIHKFKRNCTHINN